jgi:hypothetical protein
MLVEMFDEMLDEMLDERGVTGARMSCTLACAGFQTVSYYDHDENLCRVERANDSEDVDESLRVTGISMKLSHCDGFYNFF